MSRHGEQAVASAQPGATHTETERLGTSSTNSSTERHDVVDIRILPQCINFRDGVVSQANDLLDG